MLKSKVYTWQPSANIETLKQRARILARIRAFFSAREILEVETPVLCHAGVTAFGLDNIQAEVLGRQTTTMYLQTSPEYAMKRLLAAGIGSIYQISKAFRQGELGRLHNPEFTMLEWYRIGFDHHQLMQEMNDFLQATIHCPPAVYMTYQAAFQEFLQIDPHQASFRELYATLEKFPVLAGTLAETIDKDHCLQILFTHLIEPKLGKTGPIFIYDFPEAQAQLAKIIPGIPRLAARFEVYYGGMELANGFHELQNSAEQRGRFEHDILSRMQYNLPALPVDELLLAALDHGLPDCAGVALGVDRLVMLGCHQSHITNVLSFGFENA